MQQSNLLYQRKRRHTGHPVHITVPKRPLHNMGRKRHQRFRQTMCLQNLPQQLSRLLGSKHDQWRIHLDCRLSMQQLFVHEQPRHNKNHRHLHLWQQRCRLFHMHRRISQRSTMQRLNRYHQRRMLFIQLSFNCCRPILLPSIL